MPCAADSLISRRLRTCGAFWFGEKVSAFASYWSQSRSALTRTTALSGPTSGISIVLDLVGEALLKRALDVGAGVLLAGQGRLSEPRSERTLPVVSMTVTVSAFRPSTLPGDQLHDALHLRVVQLAASLQLDDGGGGGVFLLADEQALLGEGQVDARIVDGVEAADAPAEARLRVRAGS